jgi:signal transduction histidine kinase
MTARHLIPAVVLLLINGMSWSAEESDSCKTSSSDCVAAHDLTRLIPAIADYVARDMRPDLRVATDVSGNAVHVACDGHLFETILRNLLYNAVRFARGEVRVTFASHDGLNRLFVDDDGPGIPENKRQRVFESFVQLGMSDGKKRGFGLGLAIVRRAVEWHSGRAFITESPLGGARIAVEWPVMKVPTPGRG